MLANIKDYESATKYLGHKRIRPCGNNTVIERENDIVINILYHHNKIVAYLPDSIFLYNRGWFTSTTKERLNHFIPARFYVSQTSGQWFLHDRDAQMTYIWQDGITLTSDGVHNAGDASLVDATKATTKQIKRYVAGFIQALINREIEKPSGGDCWYCYMKTDDGKSLGDATNNNGHIISHMDESYYVPSLLINAIETMPCSAFTRATIGQLLGYLEDSPSEWQIGLLKHDLKSILTRYLKRELGIAA